ncbi:MAG: MerR family transcriptional regulator [Planctomycetota bacterium]
MEKLDGTMQIGDFAKLAGTNLRTLRYYEELGLLRPAARSSGGFRFYHREQLERLAAIKRLQGIGLSLKEVADALTTEEPATTQHVAASIRPAIERQIALTEAKAAKLRAQAEELQAALDRLRSMCEDCCYALAADTCDPCPRDGAALPAALRALLH